MSEETQSHYTSLIEVIHTIPEHMSKKPNGYYEDKVVARSTSEVLKVVVRADYLNEVIDKAQNHLELAKEPVPVYAKEGRDKGLKDG